MYEGARSINSTTDMFLLDRLSNRPVDAGRHMPRPDGSMAARTYLQSRNHASAPRHASDQRTGILTDDARRLSGGGRGGIERAVGRVRRRRKGEGTCCRERTSSPTRLEDDGTDKDEGACPVHDREGKAPNMNGVPSLATRKLLPTWDRIHACTVHVLWAARCRTAIEGAPPPVSPALWADILVKIARQ